MVSLIISIIICFVMFNYFSILFFPSLLLFFSIFLAAFAPLKLCAAPATHRHKVVFISASMKVRVIFPGNHPDPGFSTAVSLAPAPLPLLAWRRLLYRCWPSAGFSTAVSLAPASVPLLASLLPPPSCTSWLCIPRPLTSRKMNCSSGSSNPWLETLRQ